MGGELMGISTANCKDCFYYMTIWGDEIRCCHYLLVTNQKRPCPPGDGCTAKVQRKVIRRKKKGSDTQ